MPVTSRYQWELAAAPEAAAVDQLTAELAVSPFLATLLLQRGITTKKAYTAFTHPELASLHDPRRLHDMDKAVARIMQAVEHNEQITIYGDYDVDGLTASAIMLETLQAVGAEPTVFIPDRFTDGYGPNAEVYKYLQETGTQLLITVDNGIAGAAVIDAAQQNGLDVVVTDHHELPDQLPKAVAVVHPRYPGSDYPFGELSGAGVAFKVATALLGEPPIESIDLAALGTIADLVSLTDENRTIVQLGLKMLQTQPRVGLSALLQVADIAPEDVDETTVGFAIGPRLNALGRLGDANPGVTLLTTFDEEEAAVLANNVNDLNVKRQALVQTITKEALALAEEPAHATAKTLILAHPGWHEGVLGIVASRVVEATGKPTLVLNIDESGTRAKGSGRSVPAFHLYQGLQGGAELMTHFGGHHMAVGLTVPTANLEVLHGVLEDAAKASLTDAKRPPLAVSLKVAAADLTLAHYQDVRQLAPFGEGNPEPVFSFRPETIKDASQMGKTQAHLRFKADNLPVVAFHYGPKLADLTAASQARLAVTLNENRWQGQTTLQLMLKDWQLQAPAVIDLRLPSPHAEQFRGAFTYVFFDAKMQQQLTRRFQFGGPTVLAPALEPNTPDVVLVDLPPDEAALEAVMQRIQLPVRVVFAAEPARLVALPTRAESGRVLMALREAAPYDKHRLAALAQHVHLTTHQVIFAVQVFFELGFVRIEDAFIHIVDQPKRAPLASAKAYQQRQAFLALAHHLQTDDRAALTKRLTQVDSRM